MNSTLNEKLNSMTIADLAIAFDATESPRPLSEEVSTVRGWLLDELESRCPALFADWMEHFGKTACDAFGVIR